MNPCIDCHAAMFGKLKDIAVAEGFDFIFTGEVVGQRPMSQNRGSLNRVRNISMTSDILLRPLSAKILDPTPMEQEGLVDREKLLDLNGRGRSRQLEMARDYGFSSIPSPGGGCLLTDPGYANRLRVLRDTGLLSGENARMIRTGRMFLLDGAVGLVGRSSEENDRMLETGTGIQLDIQGIPGPLGVLIGKKTTENLTLLTAIMASYTKATEPVTAVVISGGDEVFTAGRISLEDRSRYMVTI
jgi:tRNA-specific 2-thiouridylase